MTPSIVDTVDDKTEAKTIREVVSFPPATGILTEQGLQPTDFYSRRREAIFAAAQRVMQEDGEVNEVSIWAAIEAMGNAAPKGRGITRAEIEELANGGGVTFGVGVLGKRLAERADRRRKFMGAGKIIEAIGVDDPAEYAAQVQAALEEIAADYEVDAQPSSRDEIAMALQDYLESSAPAVYYPLPWPVLNRGLPGGLLPGQTSVWFGWTNHGKSAAIDQSLQFWHERGAKCGLIATEMGLIERMSRVLQNQTGISSLKFLKKELDPEEKRRLARQIQPENMPFEFHDAQGWSYQRIAQLITVRRYDVVVIDPMNLITGFADQETITEAARTLQSVARRAGSHIAIVCHLNRNRAPRGDRNTVPKPRWYDIRDSGMIANNADIAIGVYRDQDEQGEAEATGEIYIDKIRVGFKEKLFVSLEPVRFKFDPITEEERNASRDLPGFVGAGGGGF